MSFKSNYANVNQNEVLLQIQSEWICVYLYKVSTYTLRCKKHTWHIGLHHHKKIFGDNTPRHLHSIYIFVFISYAWHASLNYMSEL